MGKQAQHCAGVPIRVSYTFLKASTIKGLRVGLGFSAALQHQSLPQKNKNTPKP